jgi:RNA polymerase sigma factor (sigma-70 family)
MSNDTVIESKDTELNDTIHREKGKLFGFINGKMPSAEDAEDILQDVFYELVETSRQVETIEQVASWLYRVARNKITDWYRKRKPERFENRAITTDEDDEPLLLADILASLEETPEDKMLRNVIMEQLAEALELLPEKQKDVL